MAGGRRALHFPAADFRGRMSKRALILGIGGMDGSYLAEVLLDKGYSVHGLYRRSSVDNLARIRHLLGRVTLHQGDMADSLSVREAICLAQPSLIFNEADQDSVGWSFNTAGLSVDITYGGLARLLEFLRRWDEKVRVFQPLSATMFGAAPPPQDESTPFAPASPYACAKTAAYYLCQHYRREYGLHVSTAILFNHDSPRRGPGYLLQRIARREPLWGDLQEVVDVGHAREYMEAAWRIMQLDRPDDFVLGTGRGYRIADLASERHPKPVGAAAGLRADAAKARAAFGFAPTMDAPAVLEEIRCALAR